ncbi:hypothetical protein SDJN02_15320 [Cucurbita argyrosperma subsp. argyrosperma]|nr:hypothetical protein SDJN02_15320 [Cucurbita argyrosperma subsp. argyrosperma]
MHISTMPLHHHSTSFIAFFDSDLLQSVGSPSSFSGFANLVFSVGFSDANLCLFSIPAVALIFLFS